MEPDTVAESVSGRIWKPAAGAAGRRRTPAGGRRAGGGRRAAALRAQGGRRGRPDFREFFSEIWVICQAAKFREIWVLLPSISCRQVGFSSVVVAPPVLVVSKKAYNKVKDIIQRKST